MTTNLLLGTYTRRDSKGIYQVSLNKEKKRLENLSLISEIGSPTYLDTKNNDKIILSIINENGQGGIASLLKQDDGSYQRKDQVMAEGESPAYIRYDRKRDFIYTSNYHKGEVAVYAIDSNGSLKLLEKVVHSGHSVHENQQSPHAHYSDLTPDQEVLVVCDLGTDEVYTYDILDNGRLNEISRLKVAAGTGPRHIVFHPTLNIAYLFGELSSEVIVLEYQLETGTFLEKQVISTIPADYVDFNGGAAIRVSKDGKFLYASNRGHDSLAIFKIENNGKLILLDYVATEGETPRDFNFVADEDFIVVAHQDSDNLTLFERDKVHGTLKLLQKDFYAPEVVCVLNK